MKRTFILILPCLITVTGIFAQEQVSHDTLRNDAVKVFIDCHRCDMNYIRDEIPYVNYVRDVREAQVYILETSQETGSGGSEFTLTFTGQFDYSQLNDTLVYNSRPDDPEDIIREGRTQMIRLGLMRYVARSPMFNLVEIKPFGDYNEDEVTDRWDSWVFEIDFDPNFELEESRKEIVWENSLSAYRITPGWKFEFEFEHDLRKTTYNYNDSTYSRFKRSLSQDNLVVKSISDHWSAGVRIDIGSSSYSNLDLTIDITPAIEYNIYPYEESTRRQLRILYGIGYTYNDYTGTSIYGKDFENLVRQGLDVAYQVKQKWGTVNLSLEASNYMHDFSKNRFELDAYIQIRLFKGLSFQVMGSAARIRDQLGLSGEDMDEADILLELQEQATAYSFDGGIGFTYTFGSIYNNIVNPRFGN